MGKATLTSQFFAAVRDTGKPKLPALLVVLALREIEHKSFQVRLYDGAEKYSGCSTTKDIYTQLCEKKLNSEVPFVIRVDDVVIKDEFLPEENRMLRMVFIKKGAILKCQAPDEAYEIVRESQLRSQKRLEDSVDHHQIENMEPRAQCAQERVAHEQPGPSFSSFAQRPKAAITPRKTPLKNQVTPEKTGGSPVTPIAFLTPHVKGYKLCGLAHSKSNVMPITTEKRIHDRVFSFTLTDGNIDEIKISAFDDLADYYHRIIENDKMYYVKSTGKMSSTMREVNPQYNNTNTAYEITLKERNMIEDCHNAEKIVRPPLLLNRVMVSELSGKQEKHVDVLGIVTEISEIHMVTIQKTGREVWKRTVTLLDETNTSVHLLLWGNEAEIFPENAINKALAVQHAIVKEWNGNYSLQVMGSTKLEFDPHTRVAVDVKSWFENRNPHSTPVCISEMSDFVTNMLTRDLRTIGSMSNLTVNSLSEDSRGTYFTIVGSIIDFKRNSVCYKACVNNDCRKKVVETQEGSGMYRCETCDLSAAAFKYITLLSFLVADCTGVHWVSMFGDQANKLLKVQSSDELGSMSLDELNGLLDSILFHPMTFRMRAKVEYFNDTENIKWHCFEASTVHSAMFLKTSTPVWVGVCPLKDTCASCWSVAQVDAFDRSVVFTCVSFGTVSSTISESLLDSSTLSSDDFESESSSSTLSFYSSRSRTVSSTSSEAEFASLESDESSGSECSSTSESDEEAPEILVPFVGRHKWKYDCRSFWSDEPDDRSIQETIDEEDVPKIPLSKLLASGEVLKHPISFRDLLALANYASKNVHKGHKVQREDLINVTEHVGALSIQSVFTVAVKYQQYIVGLQRQRPEQILKSYERPALPPGFDCLHARSSLDRNVNRFPFFDRCVDWYCVPLHVYQRIVKETLIQMYDKAQLLKERRKVEKQMEKLRVKENNVFMNPIAAVAATANTNEMDPLVQEEVERVQFRRPRARNQILNDESPAKKTIFAEYWSADVVQRGLKSGELIEGVVRINPRNYEESYISNPQGSAYPDIAILGMADRNRALNGDVAVCKLKDRSLWIVKQEAYEKWCSEKQSTFRSVAEHCTQAAPQRDKEVEAEFSEFISSFTPSPQCLQNLDKASPSPCDMTYDRDELLRCLAKIELTRRLSKTEEVEGSPALRGLSQGENEATELNWYFKQGFKSFDRDVFEKLVDINVYKQLGTSPGNHLSDNDDGDVMEHPPGLMKRQRKPSNPVAETSSSDSETKKKAKKGSKKARKATSMLTSSDQDVVENLDSKVKQQLKHSIRRGIIREENRRKKDGEKYLECVHPQVTKEMQNIHKKANNSHQNRRPILKNTFTQKFVEDLPLSQRDIPDYCLQKTAQIVAISEKKHTRMAVGSLKPFTGNNFVLFSPQDSRIPRLVIDVACVPDFYENTSAYEGKIYLCRMVDWYANAQFARGTLVQCLGKAGDIETETEGILSKMHFDTREYPDEFTEEILPEVFSMADAEKRKRKDFTNECIFTIDPKTARDLDDALHVKKLDDDQYEVGVHIADVSHFVKEGTKVDAWARERTTSVYMVQKVIPMLPRLLCEELCSLQPGVERLAFSVIWKMDKNFKIIDKKTVFCRSIIKSCIKLSYEHAQDIIDGKTDLELPDIHGSHTVENIKNSVLLLYEISKVLKRNRIKNGALRLDGPKMCFDIDDEGLPRSVLVYERKEANFLVEEFMLLANIEVATKINKKFPKLAFLRRHEAPKELVLEATLKQLENLGISIDGRSSGTISESLRKYEENRKTKNTIAQLLVHLLMKPMQLAKYFCVATVPDEIDYRHYALSVPLYTHFTSPIRRYPDVIVHRLLAAAIDPDHYSPPTQSVEQLTRIAKRCNEKKYDAKTASEESDELFFNTLLRKKGNIETLGIVVQVTQVSLEVLLVKYGIVDRIAFKNIPHAKCNPHCSTDSPSLEIVWENNEFGTIKLRMLSVVKVLLKPNPAHCINRMATMEPISVEGLTKLKAKLEKTDLNDL